MRSVTTSVDPILITTRFWWVRHAPVPDGGRIYGQQDLPCDCSDNAVFDWLARTLPSGAVWATSNLLRAKQTAAAILAAGHADAATAAPVEVADFAEQNLGAWQGRDRVAFFAGRAQSPMTVWFNAPEERAPEGESFVDLVDRTKKGVAALSEKFRGRDIIVIAHGGTIRAALGLALDLTPLQMLSFSTDNCSLTQIRLLESGGEQGWRVMAVNQRLSQERSQPAQRAAGALA